MEDTIKKVEKRLRILDGQIEEVQTLLRDKRRQLAATQSTITAIEELSSNLDFDTIKFNTKFDVEAGAVYQSNAADRRIIVHEVIGNSVMVQTIWRKGQALKGEPFREMQVDRFNPNDSRGYVKVAPEEEGNTFQTL